MSRPISDTWFISIKEATRALIRACNGIVSAGEIAHASKSEVSRWQGATDPDVIPLTAVLALEAECGMPIVTTVMAHLHGRRLEGEGQVSAADIALHHASTMRAVAELMGQGAAALADGRVTPNEAMLMTRAVSDIDRSLAALRQALASVHAGQGV